MLHRRDEKRSSTFPERCQPYIMTPMRAINRITVLKVKDFLIIYGSVAGEGHGMEAALPPMLHKQHGKEQLMVRHYTRFHSESTIFRISFF